MFPKLHHLQRETGAALKLICEIILVGSAIKGCFLHAFEHSFKQEEGKYGKSYITGAIFISQNEVSFVFSEQFGQFTQITQLSRALRSKYCACRVCVNITCFVLFFLQRKPGKTNLKTSFQILNYVDSLNLEYLLPVIATKESNQPPVGSMVGKKQKMLRKFFFLLAITQWRWM